MKKAKYLLSLLFLLFITINSVSDSYADATASHNEANIELIAGNIEDGTLKAGLYMDILKGWKTYWRTPGDGGLAAEIDWQGSENIGKVEILWPAPKRFIAFGEIETFGYKDELVLPLNIEIIDPEKPIKLSAKIDYAICDEICIFFSDTLSLDLPTGHTNLIQNALIKKFTDLIPTKNGTNGLVIDDNLIVSGEGKKYGNLEVRATSTTPFVKPDIFIEGDPNIRFPAPIINYKNNKQTAIFTFKYEKMIENVTLANRELALTLVDEHRSVETPVQTGGIVASHSFMMIMLFAFIGGLILNVMPCVLPVLSLKILGVIQHGGKHYTRVRLSFLSSALGIIVSFLALASLILAIKATGVNVGWGFHFQEPNFIIAMVTILILFAANMWGFFEIRMPQFINNLIPKEDDHTLIGHFFLGALATLLATPCSAPFLGTAIGFAFTQGSAEMFYTFGMMGVGLAFPYLLVAIKPSLVSSLPRPGHWMITFKIVLGWLLAATALWLIWVTMGLLGYRSAILLLLLSLSIISILAITRKGPSPFAVPIIIVVVFLNFYLPTNFATKDEQTLSPEYIWVKFEPDKIPDFVKQGKVVFVDITADWCLTCKVNKVMVLEREQILKALSSPDVIAMEGDWTKPSEIIADYLSSYNRHGIPFNIVFGPDAPKGIILSELLTQDAVLNALEEAKTTK
jgi:suppressor for copper-sensitivity B